MSEAVKNLPLRRGDLVVRQVGTDEYVVKDPLAGTYFRLGQVEYFLLQKLDGRDADQLRAAFREQFDEELSADEVSEFLEIVRSRNLVRSQNPAEIAQQPSASANSPLDDEDDGDAIAGGGQSVLYWRKSLFNPDQWFTQFEPLLRFIWTPAFVTLSALLIVAAFLTAVGNWDDLRAAAPDAMRWETVWLAWITIVLATLLHECAHGLTCKHFGGEVREIGVLFVLLTPCLYCNVSDAWLFRKKSQRLWVTFAGGYCDLCLWALAVFVWRLTVPLSGINYIAWVIATVCSTRIAFNFNPLSRLDGYYLLSDLVDIPNLRPRSAEYWMGHVRWLLWGAPRPERTRFGRLLVAYGFARWLFAAMFLYVIIFSFFDWMEQRVWGLIMATALTTLIWRRIFKGFLGSEFNQMIKTRPIRTAVWLAVLMGGPVVLFTMPWRHTVTGHFHIRPGIRSEVRAPVAGFLSRIPVDEGDLQESGTVIAEIRIPDLDSLIVRKQAEIRECEANLSRLKAGARPEQIEEQKARVTRAESWRDLARRDLDRAHKALDLDLLRLDLEIQQVETEKDFSRGSLALSSQLYEQGALAGETLRSERKRQALLTAQHAQTIARRKARETEGVKAAEEDLVRRDKELAEAKASLALLLAGSRPEEIAATTAQRARLQEELQFLTVQCSSQTVKSSVAGIVSTPRLHDRIGEYVEKGALICVLEDIATLHVEIVIPEEDVRYVELGQRVELKARSLPFDTVVAKVERIAPAAIAPASATDGVKNQNSVTVYCRVDNAAVTLKSGTTGAARICCGTRSAGAALLNRALKYLRTEFWW